MSLTLHLKTLSSLPYLCSVGVGGVEKLMPVWHWLNILKKWGTSPELNLPNQNIQ